MEGSFSSKLVARPQGISKKKALSVPFDVEPCLAIICDLNLSTIFTKTSVKLQKHIPPVSGY